MITLHPVVVLATALVIVCFLQKGHWLGLYLSLSEAISVQLYFTFSHLGCFRSFLALFKLGGFVSGGQEPIVPDAYKTPGKYMGRKPPEELNISKNCLFLLAPFPVVLIVEVYRFLIHINQAMVTDGYLMGIPAQIFNHCFGRSKGPLGIDYPFGSKRRFGNNPWYVNPFTKLSQGRRKAASAFYILLCAFYSNHYELIRSLSIAIIPSLPAVYWILNA